MAPFSSNSNYNHTTLHVLYLRNGAGFTQVAQGLPSDTIWTNVSGTVKRETERGHKSVDCVHSS